MRLVDILVWLFTNEKGVTKARIEKAQGLAVRSGISWESVRSAMTPAQRKQVDDASQEQSSTKTDASR